MSDLRVDVHLGPGDIAAALRADVAAGLSAMPKELPPKWFYDDHGSMLFDQITRLPEYYPTRCESEILAARADAIADLTGADTLVELGSGTSEKTRLLLTALQRAGRLRRFVPFDVCEPVLRTAGAAIAQEYPGTEVHAVVGDFEHHLGSLPDVGRRLVAFLGGTIGNLEPDQRHRFLASLAAQMGPEDALLLGTDLVKDPAVLEAAYDDGAGVTAAFNRNVLAVINRQLDGDFVLDRFTHVVRFDPVHEWVEMRLRAGRAHSAHIGALDMDVRFAEGEEIRTEVSTKFRREGVESELLEAGLKMAHWWTDPRDQYGLSLSFAG